MKDLSRLDWLSQVPTNIKEVLALAIRDDVMEDALDSTKPHGAPLGLVEIGGVS